MYVLIVYGLWYVNYVDGVDDFGCGFEWSDNVIYNEFIVNEV